MEAASYQIVSPQGVDSRPLKVLIDGRKIGDGGIGIYIENLVRGLLEVGSFEVTVIAKPGVDSSLFSSSRLSWIFDSARPYSFDELFFLPRRLALSGFDLFHVPHYTLPFRLGIPTVVTVHDLIHMTHPERFYYPPIARLLIGSAVRRADAVVAVSQATRRQLIDTFGVSEHKVSFVPNAVAQFVASAADRGAARRDLEDPYLLAVVSTPKPHKGVSDLLRAYGLFRTQGAWRSVTAAAPRLVIAGFGSSRETAAPVAVEGVEFAGAVPADALGRLYSGASALVVASLAEGFCLPALEAQAVGTTVVCRPVPAIQELVADRGVVAADLSVEALAAAMSSGFLKGANGSAQPDEQLLARYSTKTVAQQIGELYRRVVVSKVTP